MSSDADASGPHEEEFRHTFARRQRVSLAVLGFWGVTGLVVSAQHHGWVQGLQWVASLWDWWAFAVGATLIWAYRCPACRGGIKLDGKTCSSCGRVFPGRAKALDPHRQAGFNHFQE